MINFRDVKYDLISRETSKLTTADHPRLGVAFEDANSATDFGDIELILKREIPDEVERESALAWMVGVLAGSNLRKAMIVTYEEVDPRPTFVILFCKLLEGYSTEIDESFCPGFLQDLLDKFSYSSALKRFNNARLAWYHGPPFNLSYFYYFRHAELINVRPDLPKQIVVTASDADLLLLQHDLVPYQLYPSNGYTAPAPVTVKAKQWCYSKHKGEDYTVDTILIQLAGLLLKKSKLIQTYMETVASAVEEVSVLGAAGGGGASASAGEESKE